MADTGARAPERRRPHPVVGLGQEFIGYCGRVDDALRGRWATVNDRLQRAAASAVAETGAALEETCPDERSRRFGDALRSCHECRRCLRGLQAVEAIPAPLAVEGLRRLRDLQIDLLRLATGGFASRSACRFPALSLSSPRPGTYPRYRLHTPGPCPDSRTGP